MQTISSTSKSLVVYALDEISSRSDGFCVNVLCSFRKNLLRNVTFHLGESWRFTPTKISFNLAEKFRG